MTLTLPEHLLLMALHDGKGTVHPAAFLALEHGLQGAVLAELRLQGRLRTTSQQHVKRTGGWQPTGFHPVDLSMKALEHAPDDATVIAWMERLDRRMPHLKAVVTESLERRGILDTADRERALLNNATVHPMRNQTAESEMRARLTDAIRADEPPTARLGTLLALAHACNLVDTLFPEQDRAAAGELSDWVADRDAVVRAVREVVAKSEGTWTG